MPTTGYRSTRTGEVVERRLARRRTLMLVVVTLGVSVLVGLLGYALFIGPAFFN